LPGGVLAMTSAERPNCCGRSKRSAREEPMPLWGRTGAVYHGGGGAGWVGPSLADGRWRYGGTDGALFQSIFDGRPHGMPAFGGILSPDAIWKLVTYVQSLEPPADVPTERWP